jgi:hypothetical protein
MLVESINETELSAAKLWLEGVIDSILYLPTTSSSHTYLALGCTRTTVQNVRLAFCDV